MSAVNKIKDTAIVRLEQFYPLNAELLKRITTNYPKAKDIVWCQEEPKNMGGWTFIAPRMMETIECMPRYAGRAEAASPAVGSLALHKREQAKLVEEDCQSFEALFESLALDQFFEYGNQIAGLGLKLNASHHFLEAGTEFLKHI